MRGKVMRTKWKCRQGRRRSDPTTGFAGNNPPIGVQRLPLIGQQRKGWPT
jgi:hypothetical protein